VYYGLPDVDPWDEARDATPVEFRDLLLSMARSATITRRTA